MMPANTTRIASNNPATGRIVRNTLMLYFRQILTMLVSLYTVRVVLETLGAEDYGIYNIVGGIVAMLGFLSGTLNSGTQRFLTFQLGREDFAELEKTFSAALAVHVGLAVLLLILAETAGLWFLLHKINVPAGREQASFWVYQFSLFFGILLVIQSPFNACLIAHEQMNIYAYISMVESLLKLGIVYVLSLSRYDKLITYAVLVFAASLVVAGSYHFYCTRKYAECHFRFVSDRTLYKSLLTFSGWNIFGSGAVLGATQGVNILLNMFFGPVVNAARGIAVQVNSALYSFVSNFQTAINPQIVKLYAAKKMDELYSLLFQNSKFSFCIMWILFLPVSLQLDTLLTIWLVEVPQNTVLFCRLILLQALVFSMQRPFVMAIHATGRMKTPNLTAGIVLLSVLPVSYFLLKINLPAYIPFVVYIGASVITSSIELCLLHRWIKLPLARLVKKVYLPISGVVICSLPLSLLANTIFPDNFVSLLFVSVISGLLVLISVYFIALNRNMRGTIKNRILRRSVL